MEKGSEARSEHYQSCPSDQALAGKAPVCSSCPGRQICLTQGGFDPDQKFVDIRMNAIKNKILIVSGKGGVGKSSICAGLSMGLAQLCGKNKVGIADLDICGPSIPKLLQVDGQSVVSSEYGWQPLQSPLGGIKVISTGSLIQENQTAIVWRGPRKTSLIKRFLKDAFWGRLEYLFFDTPPGTSDEHLTIIKLLLNAKPDGVIIVCTPQEVVLSTIRKEINFCRKMGIKILGLIQNMDQYMCPCCNEVVSMFEDKGGISRLMKEYDVSLIGRVPFDPDFVKCCEEGKSVIEEYPNSQASTELMNIARVVHKQTHDY
ncbi:PREDICTED: cytosolic Fe-S cluster assembly factor NUBP1 homolog [Amphimedon queenslandica]|uniref:Cytosolic Fe-S cluster assembly factor NUBP1 homolog n=1 Tax=Amphimedon queenslandica TaxID=400682 RepID=A0AAN0J4K9_AMPQE|nr:PREDICTED: cytosolic Fe-S cluster assembly factor NUBP1 homolog [Amphimedon queenslandica]|eukprot:XP_019851940.1 PREDICTED: cytosolic Fe-S cluster assembly factor NUBP1 homolog [Amphimedon queenslandica]